MTYQHRLNNTTSELREWLPRFQAELVEDFHTPDGTRRPSIYQYAYQQAVCGMDNLYADEKVILPYAGENDYYFTPEEYLAHLWENDPDKVKKLARQDYPGFHFKKGIPHLDDVDDFYALIASSNSEVTVTGMTRRHALQESHLHLTRKAADHALAMAPYRHPEGARSYSDSTHHAPDLEKLLELIYALDLDKSTLVFKEGI